MIPALPVPLVAPGTNASSNKATVVPPSRECPEPRSLGELDVSAIGQHRSARGLGRLGLMRAEELVEGCAESLADNANRTG